MFFYIYIILFSAYATIEHAKWEDEASTVREQLLREIKEHGLNHLRVLIFNNSETDVVSKSEFVQTSCILSFFLFFIVKA